MLPSSMRKKLVLKPYDFVDVEMVGNKILLKKHKPLDDIHSISPQPLAVFHQCFGIPTVLCDCTDPIQSFGCGPTNQMQLTPELINELKATHLYSEKKTSILISGAPKTVEQVFPIRINYRLAGAILLLSSDKLLSVNAVACAKYIAKYLEASICTA